jgi:membrane dipeptidase
VLEPAERYTGYTAYEYLEAGKDYRELKLAKQIGRVPPYQGLDLTDEQEDRTRRLLRDEIVISLHDHVQVFPEDMSNLREHIRQGREPTGYEGLARSGMTAVWTAHAASAVRAGGSTRTSCTTSGSGCRTWHIRIT